MNFDISLVINATIPELTAKPPLIIMPLYKGDTSRIIQIMCVADLDKYVLNRESEEYKILRFLLGEGVPKVFIKRTVAFGRHSYSSLYYEKVAPLTDSNKLFFGRLQIEAASPGDWGNYVSVDIYKEKDKPLNISVLENNVVVEHHVSENGSFNIISGYVKFTPNFRLSSGSVLPKKSSNLNWGSQSIDIEYLNYGWEALCESKETVNKYTCIVRQKEIKPLMSLIDAGEDIKVHAY